MQPSLEDAFRALDNAADEAGSIRIELDPAYLRAIALLEAVPENRPGADKSWVWRAGEAFRLHYARSRRR